MSNQGPNQYHNPTPPLEVTQLGYGDTAIIYGKKPLLNEQESSVRGMEGYKVVTDISIKQHWSTDPPIEFSVIEVELPLSTEGKPTSALFLRKLNTDANGNKYYDDKIDCFSRLELDENDNLSVHNLRAMNLPEDLAGSIRFQNDELLGDLYIQNLSNDKNIGISAKPGEAYKIPSIDNPQIAEWQHLPDGSDFTIHADVARKQSNRPQIGRDRPVEGEYTTAQKDGSILGEIIIVDTKREGGAEKNIYDDLVKKANLLSQKKKGLGVLGTLYAVENLVRETLPYSLKGVENFLKRVIPDGQGGIKNGAKVDLTYFISEGLGVCRHQALLAGKLLESMTEQHMMGVLPGNTSVERNALWNPITGEVGGHAWVRYTAHDGEIYIIDVARGFTGTLKDAMRRKGGWNYLRPAEQNARHAKNMGRATLMSA